MQLNHWLSSVCLRLQSSRRRRGHRADHRSLLISKRIENLEDRALLTVQAAVVGTELFISSNGADNIAVQSTSTIPAQVQVLQNGVPLQTLGSIPAASLTRIEIDGGDGNNTIDLRGITSSVFNPSIVLIVDGGNGNDTIFGSNNIASSLSGGDGADTITGGSLNDTLRGGNGNDLLNGGNGNDILQGQDGLDSLVGGAGNDIVDGGASADTIDGGDGTDSLLGGSGTDSLLGGLGNDTLDGGSGNDTLDGQDGNDSLRGGSDHDSLLGSTGIDSLNGESGRDTLDGGTGDDSLDGGDDADSLLGGDGNDFALGSLGNDTVVGQNGNDLVYGGGGHDQLFGDSQDTLQPGTGNDIVLGHAGNDTINGGGGTDTLQGDAGNDVIRSGDLDSDNTPVFTISGPQPVTEGDSGSLTVNFTVSLQRAFSTPVSVTFSAQDGTAVDGSDYQSVSQTLTFSAGQTQRTVSITVLSDTIAENDEVFYGVLSNPAGGSLGTSAATALIRDNDQWLAIGPSPTTGGQVENITPNNEVVGAAHTVVAHPTNPDILYIGATNGGVWRTSNATSSSPTWIPLTDELTSQNIGAMTLDRNAPNRVLAGFGRFSSFGGAGGARDGLILSEDGGNTWRQIQDPLLVGRNISGVVLQGSLMLASANFFSGGGGLYRSTDNGFTWSFVSGTNGLSGGAISDLVSDPTNASRFYVAVTGVGVFRSDDSGANWVNISSNDASANGVAATITNPGNNNAEMAVGSNGRVYIGVLVNGQPGYIGYTDDGGTTWVRMDLPTTLEGNGDVEGLSPRVKPGSQGAIHFSIVVDPTDPNIVYVAGDRQDTPFPNFLGANDFSARIFRGDTRITATGATPSPQWAHMTHRNDIALIPTGGTASSSSPHADSREMTFDAAGNLIESDDGGVYRRTNPRSNTGDWFSINGNLQITEFHDIAYDTVANIITGGAQDTGTPEQLSEGSLTWRSVSTADGGDVAIDTVTQPGVSIRYSSFQNLGGFRRRVVDASNNVIATTFPARTVTGNGAAFVPQFVTPIVTNTLGGNRLILGGGNNPYESFNGGNTITELNIGGGVNEDAIAYGGIRNGVANPDVLYVGSGNRLFVRTAGTGVPIQAVNYPGGFIRGITLDPNDWMTAFVSDTNSVYRTTNAGATWIDVTGNLSMAGLQAIEYISGTVNQVVVGGVTGVFRMLVSAAGTWSEFDTSLPTVPVFDLDYDPADDVLVAGTLGRGAWLFRSASVISAPGSGAAPAGFTGIASGDSILGGDGNDTIFGADGDDYIDGQDGADSLLGGGGQDTLVTGPGDDTTNGGSGDDTVSGEQGNNELGGGSGSNAIILEAFASGASSGVVGGGSDTVIVRGNAFDNQISIGQSGNRMTITTAQATFTLSDSVSTVRIETLGGNDTVNFGHIDKVRPLVLIVDLSDGDDVFNGQGRRAGRVPVQVIGGEGNDTLTGTAGNDIFEGGNGNDSLTGAAGDDSLDGGEGSDTLVGGLDNDRLRGRNGDDDLRGEEGDDLIEGGDGDDIGNGSYGHDTILGENGNDTIFGAVGNDLLQGGNGADFIRGHTGNDAIAGGDGDDTLRGDGGNDTINGGDGNDSLIGGDGNDLMTGSDGHDYVLGDNGNDTLLGEDGDDTMLGAAGNDIVLGGDGDDLLSGNGGARDTVAGNEGDDSLVGDANSEIRESFVLAAAISAALQII